MLSTDVQESVRKVRDPLARGIAAVVLAGVALVLVILPVPAGAGGETMTPLDRALEVARKQPEKQSDFYNLFLKTEIFIPTHDVPVKEGRRRAGSEETLRPIIIESDGQQYLMLFDSKERLSAWADREVGFVAMPGHAVVQMMGPDIRWALNAGTDHLKVFVPEEIKWLKDSLQENQVSVEEGTRVLIGAPARIPDGLLEALSECLSRNPEVREAYLGEVSYAKEGEVPHLALVLRIDAAPESAVDAIRQDLGVASRGLLGEDGYIDIFVDEGGVVATEVTKVVKPFYVRSERP